MNDIQEQNKKIFKSNFDIKRGILVSYILEINDLFKCKHIDHSTYSFNE